MDNNQKFRMTCDNLLLDRCEVEDDGRQRCRLGPQLMKQIGVKCGDVIQFDCGAKAYICSVWPRVDGCEGFCQFDSSVHLSGNCGANLSSKCVEVKNLRTLSKSNALSVCVMVVVSRQKSSEHDSHGNADIEWRVKNLLYGKFLTKDAIVDCRNHASFKLYNISHILISDISTGNETNCGQVKKNTKISVDKVCSQERFLQRQQHKLSGPFGGLEGPLRALTELVELPFKYRSMITNLGCSCPKGALLRGPPGCGKTSLVKKLAALTEAYIVTMNGPEVFGSRPGEGESNLKDIFDQAIAMSKEGPCILFIDELDTVCPRKGQGVKNQEGRMSAQLGTLMDSLSQDDCLVVIGATNRPNIIDPALRRPGRFEKEIFIGVPNQEQRYEILQAITQGVPSTPALNLWSVAEMTPGFVGADLVSLVQQSFFAARRKQCTDMSVTLSMEDVLEALHSVTPSTQRGSDILVDYKPVEWQSIGGLSDVKTQLIQAIEWPLKHPDSFSRLGVPRPRGVLLYGPPGCAKTTLVRAAATACNATFLSISGGQLYSPYVGDSERKLVEVFQQARAGAPSILFIDEIDSVVGRRDSSGKQKGVQERVLSALLNEMDGIGVRLEDMKKSNVKELEGEMHEGSRESVPKSHVENQDVLLVAATNRPDMLDDALLRPGRIDRIIYVPSPDQEARCKILEVHGKKMPLKDVDLEMVAQRTDGYTGADLENLCREAGLHALSKEGLSTDAVTAEHFLAALETVTPSLTKKQMESYSKLKVSRK